MSARWTDGEDEAYVDVVLRRRMVRTAFRPIVRLDSGLPTAFHALTRGPLGSPLEQPDRLAAAAAGRGVTVALDHLCFATALDAAERARLAAPLCVFVPRDPYGVLHRRASGETEAPIVVEFDAQSPADVLADAAACARSRGWTVALGELDVKTGPAVVAAVEPDFVVATSSACDALSGALRETNTLLVASGLDTEYATVQAMDAGVEYGYGLRFGRPDLLVRAPVVFDHDGLPTRGGARDYR